MVKLARTSPISVFVLQRWFFRQKEKDAGQSTWRVLSWHGKSSEYLEGAAEEIEVVMWD
jgi:hypothetical protein